MKKKSISKKDKAKIEENIKKSNEPKKAYTFRLDDQVIDDLNKYCKKTGYSKTSVIEELLRSFLNNK